MTFHWKEAHGDLSTFCTTTLEFSELTLLYPEEPDAPGFSQAIILTALRGHWGQYVITENISQISQAHLSPLLMLLISATLQWLVLGLKQPEGFLWASGRTRKWKHCWGILGRQSRFSLVFSEVPGSFFSADLCEMFSFFYKSFHKRKVDINN